MPNAISPRFAIVGCIVRLKITGIKAYQSQLVYNLRSVVGKDSFPNEFEKGHETFFLKKEQDIGWILCDSSHGWL